ncbi:MAG: SDR family oxidoreductase [Pseudomonadota bacterium]|nr:SDR family oxidoreductase [Pseudomonadota bacterium]
MKCLVTGAAGFIGSHLTDLLLAEGHDVVAVDDLSTGRLANLEGARRHRGFAWIEADIADPRVIADLPAADWVFHIAGRADLVPSIEKPDEYFRVNVSGTFLMLEYTRRVGARRFVYTASSTCYGIAEQVPTPEDYPCLPRHPYGLTKYLGEQLVMHWAQVYKLPAVSLRLFNVYGPRSRTTGTYGAVFGVFLKQKLSGKPFTIVGDGNQTRDFTFVTDVARAFLVAAASNVSGEIFNVGSDNTYSVNRLVELLGGEKIFIPKRPGEPDCTYADINKIKTRLGWQPRVAFEEGVARMLALIEDWKDAPLWDREKIAEATRDWFKYLQ